VLLTRTESKWLARDHDVDRQTQQHQFDWRTRMRRLPGVGSLVGTNIEPDRSAHGVVRVWCSRDIYWRRLKNNVTMILRAFRVQGSSGVGHRARGQIAQRPASWLEIRGISLHQQRRVQITRYACTVLMFRSRVANPKYLFDDAERARKELGSDFRNEVLSTVSIHPRNSPIKRTVCRCSSDELLHFAMSSSYRFRWSGGDIRSLSRSRSAQWTCARGGRRIPRSRDSDRVSSRSILSRGHKVRLARLCVENRYMLGDFPTLANAAEETIARGGGAY
jgi:hypothetical protein